MRVVLMKNKVFLLHTQNTYAIAVTEDKYVNHLYYGKTGRYEYLIFAQRMRLPFTRGESKRKEFLSGFCLMEYPESGMGDYRESAICVRSMSGYRASYRNELIYEGYEIKKGKAETSGLPATWEMRRIVLHWVFDKGSCSGNEGGASVFCISGSGCHSKICDNLQWGKEVLSGKSTPAPVWIWWQKLWGNGVVRFVAREAAYSEHL